MLATLSLANIEFAEGIRLYIIFLVLCTGFFKLPGFIIGLSLIILSIITTPTFANKSYFVVLCCRACVYVFMSFYLKNEPN